ncbi:MAG: prepilin-type N-terminal cleavage/methylation domain-containing protein [Bacilli bacterium]
MKNKGFTLIELLAVIILLSIILTIATISVVTSVNKTKVKNRYNVAKEIVEIAASAMKVEEAGTITGYQTACITVDYLIKNDYLEKDVMDPETGKNMDKDSLNRNSYVIKHEKSPQEGYEMDSYKRYYFDKYAYIVSAEEKCIMPLKSK